MMPEDRRPREGDKDPPASDVCGGCGLLQEKLNEYMRTCLTLKQKILDSHAVIERYHSKCDELQQLERESGELRQQLLELQTRMASRDKHPHLLLKLTEELEEKKSSLRIFQVKAREAEQLGLDLKAMQIREKKSEEKMKRLSELNSKQHEELKQLRREKRSTETQLKKAQEQVEVLRSRQGSPPAQGRRRSGAVPEAGKVRIRALLRDLWNCLEESGDGDTEGLAPPAAASSMLTTSRKKRTRSKPSAGTTTDDVVGGETLGDRSLSRGAAPTDQEEEDCATDAVTATKRKRRRRKVKLARDGDSNVSALSEPERDEEGGERHGDDAGDSSGRAPTDERGLSAGEPDEGLSSPESPAAPAARSSEWQNPEETAEEAEVGGEQGREEDDSEPREAGNAAARQADAFSRAEQLEELALEVEEILGLASEMGHLRQPLSPLPRSPEPRQAWFADVSSSDAEGGEETEVRRKQAVTAPPQGESPHGAVRAADAGTAGDAAQREEEALSTGDGDLAGERERHNGGDAGLVGEREGGTEGDVNQSGERKSWIVVARKAVEQMPPAVCVGEGIGSLCGPEKRNRGAQVSRLEASLGLEMIGCEPQPATTTPVWPEPAFSTPSQLECGQAGGGTEAGKVTCGASESVEDEASGKRGDGHESTLEREGQEEDERVEEGVKRVGEEEDYESVVEGKSKQEGAEGEKVNERLEEGVERKGQKEDQRVEGKVKRVVEEESVVGGESKEEGVGGAKHEEESKAAEWTVMVEAERAGEGEKNESMGRGELALVESVGSAVVGSEVLGPVNGESRDERKGSGSVELVHGDGEERKISEVNVGGAELDLADGGASESADKSTEEEFVDVASKKGKSAEESAGRGLSGCIGGVGGTSSEQSSGSIELVSLESTPSESVEESTAGVESADFESEESVGIMAVGTGSIQRKVRRLRSGSRRQLLPSCSSARNGNGTGSETSPGDAATAAPGSPGAAAVQPKRKRGRPPKNKPAAESASTPSPPGSPEAAGTARQASRSEQGDADEEDEAAVVPPGPVSDSPLVEKVFREMCRSPLALLDPLLATPVRPTGQRLHDGPPLGVAATDRGEASAPSTDGSSTPRPTPASSPGGGGNDDGGGGGRSPATFPSPLQFSASTPKGALRVPGWRMSRRQQQPAAAGATSVAAAAAQGENVLRALDSMYPTLSGQARTLRILRGDGPLYRDVASAGLPAAAASDPPGGGGAGALNCGAEPGVGNVSSAFTKTDSALEAAAKAAVVLAGEGPARAEEPSAERSPAESGETDGAAETAGPTAAPASRKRRRAEPEALPESSEPDSAPQPSPLPGAVKKKRCRKRKTNPTPRDHEPPRTPTPADGAHVGERVADALPPAERADPLRWAVRLLQRECFDLFPAVHAAVHVGNLPVRPMLRPEESDVVRAFLGEKQAQCEEFLTRAMSLLMGRKEEEEAVAGEEEAVVAQVARPALRHSLVRVLVALWRTRGDLERPRLLCYNALLRHDGEEGALLALFVASTWRAVLLCPGPVSHAVQAVVRQRATGDLLKCLSAFLCWGQKAPLPVDLASSFLFTLQQSPKVSFQSCPDASEDLGADTWQLVLAIQLLCGHQGWSWTHDSFISKHLWPVMGKWTRQRREAERPGSAGPPVLDATAAAVLRLIGRLGVAGLAAGTLTHVQNLLKVMLTFLQEAHKQGIAAGVQQAAAHAAVDLSPCSSGVALDALQAWSAGTTVPPALARRLVPLIRHCDSGLP
ncbi:little elongation complex subunit 1-like isoform X1 [Lethenteron reissneri]|uniref:little elongation complex subunit 1-like isoform X1 n=1 Tax=Lethenteron reissneri TaxID=7753 RepID=UPI002AB6D9AE|nr:little elongation complex subunit 1-like isoform X1 [Lethenteron reissneri]